MADRTPEQKAADEALSEAIQRCRDAYYGPPPDGTVSLMTDYIVFYVNQGMTDGDEGTGIGWMVRDNNLPFYRAYGLTELGLAHMKARYLMERMEP